MVFCKEEFFSNLEYLLKTDYGVSCREASVKQLYNALSRVVMSGLCDQWKGAVKSKGKRVGYFSAEFLVGRAVYSNLLNLGLINEVKALLEEKGIDINAFEEVEDAALGNGGLGRLAACYLESAATHDIPLDGYGLRYRYGLFKQTFTDGFQTEEGDDWLKWGDPWGIERTDEAEQIDFADFLFWQFPLIRPLSAIKTALLTL